MKMKLILISIALLTLNSCNSSNPIKGYWTGSMEMNGKNVDISIIFDSEKSSFSSHDLMLMGEPIRNLKLKNNNISFSIMLDVEMLFEGAKENEQFNGNVSMQGGPPDMKITFNLIKKFDSSPIKSYSVEYLIVKSKDVNLSAEIYKPNSKELHPAIVLLHGSTTNLKNQYTFYADFFASLGFEVLIFDKRGNGESTGNYATSSYANLVDDAIACLEIMKNREDVDKGKIGLWGFSQGASLLPLIVSKTDIPTFLIAKSPEVISVAEAGAFSDSLRIINLGNSPTNGHVVAESHRQVGKMIQNGSDYKAVESFINQNAQNYSFMNQTGLYGNISINKDDFEGYYWKGQADNFYSCWKNLKTPTLVIFGADDEYVNALKNESILKNINNPKIEIKLFHQANHALKKTFNPTKYPDFDWPRVIEGYTDFVGKWVENEIKK